MSGYGETMRTLLALTALMLVLAGAVWWKTRPAENINNMPATTSSDSRVGIATVGMAGSGPTEANFPTTPPNDGGQDHELPPEPGAGQDSAPPVDPTPPQVDPEPVVIPPKPPVVPAILQYTVVSGDSLYGIVKRAYGTAPEDLVNTIATANGLADPSALGLGQVLRLPVIEGFTAPQKP